MNRHQICQMVDDIEPGQCLTFAVADLVMAGFGRREYHGVVFEVEDNVLESVVGSGYTHWYTRDLLKHEVTFHRIEVELPDGYRTYVSPDYRMYYEGTMGRFKHPRLKR